MNRADIEKQFDETVKILEKKAPVVNLVILPHPDKHMQDMDMICVQTYLTPTGAESPILFCQQIMEKSLLEERFGGVLPQTWPRLSRTKMDNDL